MPRSHRFAPQNSVLHIINRGNDRQQLFDSPREFDEFLDLVSWAKEICPVRIIAYCLLANHWHLMIWTLEGKDVPRFLHRLCTTHSIRRRRSTGTVGQGHVYQHRYHSFLVDTESYYFHLLRYVEANPVRAGLVNSARDWRWSSLAERVGVGITPHRLLDEGPIELPANWAQLVDVGQEATVLEEVRAGFQHHNETIALRKGLR